MQDILNEQLLKVASLNGIDVFQVKLNKFKTNSINIFFYDELCREQVAKNALLPAVLRRGALNYPTFQDVELHLQELYGAAFDCGVAKKGEYQIIQFYMDQVNDKYTGDSKDIFEKSFDLMFEIITNPVLEEGIFKKEYVEQEKENLKNLIESRLNDKAQYAVERCFEIMCSNEPFGIYEYGSVEDIAKIDEKILFEHYKHFLSTLPMAVFITGDIEDSKIQGIVNKLSSIKRENIKSINNINSLVEAKDVKNVVDKMNVNQGKLSVGFRTNTKSNEEDYYPLFVYNIILGGGVHSKLFQNVREKENLAYYAYSRLEKFKGLMVISSGIESQNKDKALAIILEQLKEIEKGNISDYEFDASINMIETGVRSLMDSQLQIVDFYLSQFLTKTDDNFYSLIENVRKVTREDIVRIAKKIKLDTVYFLTGEQ